MPNYTRRRRFSAQSDFGNPVGPKLQNNSQNPSGKKSQIENFLKVENVQNKTQALKSGKKIMHSKTRPLQIFSDNVPITVDVLSVEPNKLDHKPQKIMPHQEINGFTKNINSSVIAQYNTVQDKKSASTEDKSSESYTSCNIDENESKVLLDTTPSNSQHKRESKKSRNLGQQHPVKVRSPKRIHKGIEAIPTELHEAAYVAPVTITVGVDPIVFKLDNDTSSEDVILENESNDRASSHSIDEMCRICHGGDSLTSDLGLLISACACRGTVGRIHVKCLERWLTESGKSRCELCGTRYATKRVHRYGVVKALLMWILSQNAKQLLIDILGIMLMSPLAVLAAWLSGRTLAGLMTQDYANVSIWPLASTFVLACLTLVCYYCWIVSAATRHALGWWIWYRSQYEVRLELQELVENLLSQEAF